MKVIFISDHSTVTFKSYGSFSSFHSNIFNKIISNCSDINNMTKSNLTSNSQGFSFIPKLELNALNICIFFLYTALSIFGSGLIIKQVQRVAKYSLDIRNFEQFSLRNNKSNKNEKDFRILIKTKETNLSHSITLTIGEALKSSIIFLLIVKD